jgi:hypothetical protein
MWSNCGLLTLILFLTGQSLLYITEESGEQLTVVFPEVVTEPASALIKRKSNFPHIKGNSEWSSCKAIHEEELPNI